MSYGIIRVQKFGAGSVGGIQIHDKREKNYSHTNKDIDFNKTKLNYSLHNNELIENLNYREKVKERINKLDLKKAVRKDAKVMCQFLVTSDKSFFDGLTAQQKEDYFIKSYEWICKRYGKENIVSAIVHLDEKTPHMHVNFVPVTKDGRLSAKDLFKKQDLFNLHDSFYNDIGKLFGLERGETKEDKIKHLSVSDYKIKTSEVKILEENKKLEELKKQCKVISKSIEDKNKTFSEVSNSVNKARQKVLEYKSTLKPLRAEYRAKKTYIKGVKKSSEISNKYPYYVKVIKPIFGEEYIKIPKNKWEERCIAFDDMDNVKEMRKSLEESISDFINSQSGENYNKLIREINNLRNQVEDLKDENYKLKKAIENKENELENEIKGRKEDRQIALNKIDRVAKKMTPEQERNFRDIWQKDYEERKKIKDVEKLEKRKKINRGMSR